MEHQNWIFPRGSFQNIWTVEQKTQDALDNIDSFSGLMLDGNLSFNLLGKLMTIVLTLDRGCAIMIPQVNVYSAKSHRLQQ